MAKAVINLANDEEKREHLMKKSLNNSRQYHLDNVGIIWEKFFKDILTNE